MVNELEYNNGEFIIYQSDDGRVKLDVRLQKKTVWLSQEHKAMLFDKGRSIVTKHFDNI